MDLALNRLKAVVTGGTTGIGRAITFTLVAEGARDLFRALSMPLKRSARRPS